MCRPNKISPRPTSEENSHIDKIAAIDRVFLLRDAQKRLVARMKLVLLAQRYADGLEHYCAQAKQFLDISRNRPSERLVGEAKSSLRPQEDPFDAYSRELPLMEECFRASIDKMESDCPEIPLQLQLVEREQQKYDRRMQLYLEKAQYISSVAQSLSEQLMASHIFCSPVSVLSFQASLQKVVEEGRNL